MLPSMTQGSEGAAGAIVTASAAQGDLVSRIALALASPEPFAAQVQQALREMGEFLQVSRSYVFIDNDRGTTTSCTHEWCAPRISAEQANL